MNTNQTKTNMTNKSSKLIAILMLICIMISSLCMGCQKEVDGIAVKDSTARKILLAIRENNFSEANSLYNGGRISDRTADALSEALPEMLDDFITEYNAGEKDYNTCIKFCDLHCRGDITWTTVAGEYRLCDIFFGGIGNDALPLELVGFLDVSGCTALTDVRCDSWGDIQIY